MADVENLAKLSRLVRFWILYMTTKAGSGHATSALSAADIMTCLYFEKLRFDTGDPANLANDRVIFSKGHASPLLYALWTVAGVIAESDLDNYRQLGSKLEGHPTPRFKYVDAATGSLGQGLSVGLGMAIALRMRLDTSGPDGRHPRPTSSLQSNLEVSKNKFLGAQRGSPTSATRSVLPATFDVVGNPSTGATPRVPRVYVLLGDSEVAEGSVWEAVELASYYKVGNLVGIVDVNRLGQSTETMLGWQVDKYRARIEAFGWDVVSCNGHDFVDIVRAFENLDFSNKRPKMILAKTIKGRGVSFLEDKEGWHGKALSHDEFENAVKELGEVDKSIRGKVEKPDRKGQRTKDKGQRTKGILKSNYKLGEMVATRKAYGEAICALGEVNPLIISLDGETSNSTFSEIFREKFPQRYFEMFIAEQNMVGVSLGLSKLGFVPFVSTFAAFFSRAYDQIRMSAISAANIKFVGSHAGVSIGQDGPSQMGLEDFAMFRSIFGSVVFCPADGVATRKLVAIAAGNDGIFYIRTNRPATSVIYANDENFKIGGSKVLRSAKSDKAAVISCGVTLFEAMKAADELKGENINVRVIDAYSIKPIDETTLKKAASEVGGNVIVVEDHYFEGGLGDAVLNVFADEKDVKVFKLAVSKMPMSGEGDDLLSYEGIDAKSIGSCVKRILG